MTWFFYALLGAILTAIYWILVKKCLAKTGQLALAGQIYLISSIILLSFSFLTGLPEIGGKFYSALFGSVFLNFFANILYFRALKISDLSLSLPILSFTPIFLIITSFTLLGEIPSALGIWGIFLIVAGTIIANSENYHGHIEILKNLFRGKGTLYMFGVALIFSVSANFDKIVILNSNPSLGGGSMLLALGIAFHLTSLFMKEDKNKCEKQTGLIFVTACVYAFGAILLNTALKMQIVPYVISVKRISIIFGVLYGIFFLGEKNARKRIIGAILAVIGAIIIALS